MIAFLVDKRGLPPERARIKIFFFFKKKKKKKKKMLSCERKDMERLAQYIIRNPFSVNRCGLPSRARFRHPDRSSTAPA